MTRVLNLATGEWLVYSCPPTEAVAAAYAQSQGDWNTWGYEKYATLLRWGRWCVTCGDFSAFSENLK